MKILLTMDVGVVVGVKYGCSYKQFLIINVVQMFFIRVIINVIKLVKYYIIVLDAIILSSY